MVLLTLERAKELSEKKWQAIADHTGEDYNITQLIPEIDGMRNECAMCEYQLEQEMNVCRNCLYTSICNGEAYYNWISEANSESALQVLNKIKEINNR